MPIDTKTTDFDQLFEEQLKFGNKYLYVLARDHNNELRVIAYPSLEEIKKDFSYGEKGIYLFPRMTRTQQINGDYNVD
ncbi:MAG: hypothetical protein ACXWE7_10990 [Nitrososphaeraceae archaeon]